MEDNEQGVGFLVSPAGTRNLRLAVAVMPETELERLAASAEGLLNQGEFEAAARLIFDAAERYVSRSECATAARLLGVASSLVGDEPDDETVLRSGYLAEALMRAMG